MPRTNPYYSGNLASGGTTYAVPPASSGSTIAGLGSLAQQVLGAVMYNPETDPKRQQARYYGAEADKSTAEQAKILAENAAREGAGDVVGNAAPGTPISETVQKLMAMMIRAGVDPSQAAKAGAALAAGQGDAAGDAALSRYGYASTGNGLGINEGVSTADRDGVLAKDEQLKREDFASRDQTARYGDDTRLKGTRYSADASAGASRYGSDVGARTAARGQDLGAGTARRGQDLEDGRARNPTPFTQRVITTLMPSVKPVDAWGGVLGFGAHAGSPGSLATKTELTTREPMPKAAAPAAGGDAVAQARAAIAAGADRNKVRQRLQSVGVTPPGDL